MKRRQALNVLLISLVSFFSGVGCHAVVRPDASQGETPVTITVSAAASLQDALEAIAPKFQAAHPDIQVDYNFGSSGKLQQQIEQGAPVDVFFSASPEQMNALNDQDLIIPSSLEHLVTNRLVLIAPVGSTLDITDIRQLQHRKIEKFAVGEFRTVPAGQYAKQVFENLKLLNTLQSQFIFSSTVRGVLAAVESGNVDLGMVYATDAARSNRVTVLATVPQDSHQPIVYPIAVTTSSSHPDASRILIDFLAEDTAQEIFETYSFGRR